MRTNKIYKSSLFQLGYVFLFFFSGITEMLFSFKNKYRYTYPNTYIALYSRPPKLPVTHCDLTIARKSPAVDT